MLNTRRHGTQRQLQSGSPVQSSLSLSLPSTFHRFFFFFGLLFNNFEDRGIDRLPGGRPRRRSDVDSLCKEDDGRKREDGVEKPPPASFWQTHSSRRYTRTTGKLTCHANMTRTAECINDEQSRGR